MSYEQNKKDFEMYLEEVSSWLPDMEEKLDSENVDAIKSMIGEYESWLGNDLEELINLYDRVHSE